MFKGFRAKQCLPQMLHWYLLNITLLDTTLPLSLLSILGAVSVNIICPTK